MRLARVLLDQFTEVSFVSLINDAARWRGDLVAAKKLKCKLEDTNLIQAFQAETKILAKLRHPNIVMILGACCRAPDLVIVTGIIAPKRNHDFTRADEE